MVDDFKVFVIPRLDRGIQLCELGHWVPTVRRIGSNHGTTNPLLSFRPKPIRRTAKSSRSITFAECTSHWIPPVRRLGSSRGMTEIMDGVTEFWDGDYRIWGIPAFAGMT